MTEYREIIAELAEPTRELRRAIPEVWAGFSRCIRRRWPRGCCRRG